jgi:hypothetical protein
VKRTDKNEPIWVVTHICMETTQGSSLYSYLYLKLTKPPCFFFCKIGKQEGRTGLGGFAWGEGEGGGERGRRMNMV